MIAKKYRFSNFNFDKFFKLAQKKENEFFKIWILENNCDNARFSVIPSMKIFKTSVIRNQIRRKIFEILRFNLAKIKKADHVIIPKIAIAQSDFKNVTEKILELLKK